MMRQIGTKWIMAAVSRSDMALRERKTANCQDDLRPQDTYRDRPEFDDDDKS